MGLLFISSLTYSHVIRIVMSKRADLMHMIVALSHRKSFIEHLFASFVLIRLLMIFLLSRSFIHPFTKIAITREKISLVWVV